jgi:uncharacterized protein YndB with AHSA1/START domain
MTNPVIHKIEGSTLHIERTFDAPRELVFQAFSDDKILVQWWSPEGFSIPVSNMNFTVGGSWHYMMKGSADLPEPFTNMESWGLATYREIDPPTKIVLEDAFTDETGVPNPEMPTSKITYDFEEGNSTTTVYTTAEYASEEALQTVIEMGMIDGMTSAMQKLDAYLAAQQ